MGLSCRWTQSWWTSWHSICGLQSMHMKPELSPTSRRSSRLGVSTCHPTARACATEAVSCHLPYAPIRLTSGRQIVITSAATCSLEVAPTLHALPGSSSLWLSFRRTVQIWQGMQTQHIPGGRNAAGFHLNFAKMNATWGEHEPAYYVATHSERKEVVVAIRGTWAVEDVITDITALPVVCL